MSLQPAVRLESFDGYGESRSPYPIRGRYVSYFERPTIHTWRKCQYNYR